MAGQGFKDFTVGEVLTSADVDGYLMQQSVMRFADSAARGSALGTATGAGTALAEGMLTYRDDDNSLEVFDGTSWVDVAGAWEDFVPTFNNFTLGNGTLDARKRKVGTWMQVYVEVQLGSTSSVTGLLSLDAPEGMNLSLSSHFAGLARMTDVGNGIWPGFVEVSNGPNSDIRIMTLAAPAAYVGSAVPFTWSTGDTFKLSLGYEVE